MTKYIKITKWLLFTFILALSVFKTSTAKADVTDITTTPEAGQYSPLQPIHFQLNEDGVHSLCTGGGTVNYQIQLINVTDNAQVINVYGNTGSNSINAYHVIALSQDPDQYTTRTYKYQMNYSDDGGNCAGSIDISPEYTFTSFTPEISSQSFTEPNTEQVAFTIPDLPYADWGYTTVDVCLADTSNCSNYNLSNGVNTFDKTFSDIDAGTYNYVRLHFDNPTADFGVNQIFPITEFTVTGTSPPPDFDPADTLVTAHADGANFDYTLTGSGWYLLNTFTQIAVFIFSSLLFLTSYAIGKSLVRR